MKPWLKLLLLLCLMPPIFSAGAEERLLLSGSSTLAPLMSELARQYHLSHPEIAIMVSPGGSQLGIADARAGKVDIGMVSRALHPDEKDLFAFTVAREGVALVVNRENPLRSVSWTQAVELLTGRTANWKALGGPDAAVLVISRPAGYSSLEVVSKFFRLEPQDIRAGVLAVDSSEALYAAATNRHALVFFSAGLAEREAARGVPVRALQLDGIPATSAAVREGRYPLVRPLNLVTRAIPTQSARAFIEFVLSPTASKTIEQYDFVPFLHEQRR